MSSLTQEELIEITQRTIAHYDGRADAFWQGTRDHDVTQNRAALLRHIDGDPPFRVLDFGCGPGRDLKAFAEMGHEPVGLDACPSFCAMARRLVGCDVLQQDFLSLQLPESNFDGVFANASLFHVPRQELARVLSDLRNTLRPRGILFASNPRGRNQEGWSGDRYGSYHDLTTWQQVVQDVGFELLEHYYRPPGLPREQQPWLATVWRRATSGE